MDILGRHRGDDPEEPTPAPPLTSLYDRIRGFLGTVRDRCSRLATDLRSRDDRADDGAIRPVPLSADRSPTGIVAECPPMDGFPNREYPLTYPGRDLVGVNAPDVVSIETEEGLCLSVPENTDATLTSDVWTTLEQ